MMTSTGAIPRNIHFVNAEMELLVRKIFPLNATANEKKTNNISMLLLSVLGWGGGCPVLLLMIVIFSLFSFRWVVGGEIMGASQPVASPQHLSLKHQQIATRLSIIYYTNIIF